MRDHSVTLNVKIDSCVDCPHHRVSSDPDPHDWFCSDDVAVMCAHDSLNRRTVTNACRPYNTKRETTPPPSWCPLRGNGR